MAYPNLNIEPELLKVETNDEIEELKYRTQKHDHQELLKTPQIDNNFCRKKYKSKNKKKILMVITEVLIGSASTISSSTLAIMNPSAVIVISSSAALLTSIAILITNEYISKSKFSYIKLRYWNDVFTLLYEKTLKQSMID